MDSLTFLLVPFFLYLKSDTHFKTKRTNITSERQREGEREEGENGKPLFRLRGPQIQEFSTTRERDERERKRGGG